MKLVVGLVVAVTLSLAGTASAAPITFIGSDPAATSLATMPNSQAAAASFDAAAALLGSMSLINFESVALGNFAAPIALNANVTMSASSGSNSQIQDDPSSCGFNLCGGNTTVGGHRFAYGYGGDFSLTFTSPIQAFGAYFAGLQLAAETITYSNGGTQTVNIPTLSGGGAFVGFTDAGASITSILITFGSGPSSGDIISVDDMRYGPTSAARVPEPTSMLLLGTGLAGWAARRRLAKRA
jgi:hypothetical protein